MINPVLASKHTTLENIFKKMGRVLIAYSGGVDSSLLLKVGTDVLKSDCLGVIGDSASLASVEFVEAMNVASTIGAEIEVVKTEEMGNDLYLRNDDRRCFHCKSELFEKMHELSVARGFDYLVDGNNLDDTGDYRPGMEAARISNIRSPLIEAGFTKSDIRELGRVLNLPNWDKPAQPCLASRIAYGIAVTPEILKKIELAEKFLKQNEFKVVRVRFMGDHVSVEVGSQEVPRLLSFPVARAIEEEFIKIGLPRVHLDENGYLSGKLTKQHITIK